MSKVIEDYVRTEFVVLGPDDPEQRCLGQVIHTIPGTTIFSEALRRKECRQCGAAYVDRSEKNTRRKCDSCQK